MTTIIPRKKKLLCKILQCPNLEGGECKVEECTVPNMGKALQEKLEGVENG